MVLFETVKIFELVNDTQTKPEGAAVTPDKIAKSMKNYTKARAVISSTHELLYNSIKI